MEERGKKGAMAFGKSVINKDAFRSCYRPDRWGSHKHSLTHTDGAARMDDVFFFFNHTSKAGRHKKQTHTNMDTVTNIQTNTQNI